MNPLPCIKNLSRAEVFAAAPWNLNPAPPDPVTATKGEHATWKSKPDTDWFFLSGYVGTNPAGRVNEGNPPIEQHAFIADYDNNISPADVETMLKGKNLKVRPTLIHPTTSSGVRLIWLFEEPVPLSEHTLKAWVTMVAKKLNVVKLLPGLDACWEHPGQYYEWRGDWSPLRGNLIGSATLAGWRVECAEKATVLEAGYSLPFEVAAAEVEKRWPGRWVGEFAANARGCRFWDPSASNATAAIVRETGMTCFTGDKAFVSWGEIFGPGFVDQYRNDRIGTAVEQIFYTPAGSYLLQEGSEWHDLRIDAARRRLRLRGLSLSVEKGEQQSEVDKAISAVEQLNYLSGSVPVVYTRNRVVKLPDGRRVFNTATAKMVTPGDPDGGWANLRRLFEGLFKTDTQVQVWHAWVARFAERVERQNAKLLGHALIILGDPDDGKTYVASDVLGHLFGGVADPAAVFEGDTLFNANLFEKGLWTNSDSLNVSRRDERERYVGKLKAFTSNELHSIHGKGVKSIDGVPWGGRIVITGNLNENSMKLIPDSAEDADGKFCALKSYRRASKDLTWEQLHAEAPAYLAWLLQRWKAPSWMVPNHRYGFEAWQNPELMNQARTFTATGTFIETLQFLLKEGKDGGGVTEEDVTDITPTELKHKMEDCKIRLEGALKYTNQLGMALSMLKKTNPEMVSLRMLHGGSRWSLHREAIMEGGTKPSKGGVERVPVGSPNKG